MATHRCEWVAGGSPLDLEYHDREWGVPVRDDRRLFEMLTLEGAQAGLSWSTILKKREGYRRAFAGFDPQRVARFNRRSVERLLGDAAIVRHRGKIESTITNARALLDLQSAEGSFSAWIWEFVNDRPLQNHWQALRELPPSSAISERMSKALKSVGFRFVGPTTCYAFMQAAGLVNDHTVDCFRHREVAGLSR